MIVRIQFKDPDGVGDSIREAVSESVMSMDGLHPSEKDALIDRRQELVEDACSKFIECSEYVTIEIDTEAGTARVVPVR